MSNSPLQTKLAAQDLYERGEIKIDVVHLEEIYSDLLGISFSLPSPISPLPLSSRPHPSSLILHTLLPSPFSHKLPRSPKTNKLPSPPGDEQLHFLVAYHFLHTSLITRLDISKLHSTISNDVDQLSHDIPEHPFVGIFNLCMEVMSTWSFNNYCNLTTLPSDKQLKEFQQKDEKLQSWAVNSHPRDSKVFFSFVKWV